MLGAELVGTWAPTENSTKNLVRRIGRQRASWTDHRTSPRSPCTVSVGLYDVGPVRRAWVRGERVIGKILPCAHGNQPVDRGGEVGADE